MSELEPTRTYSNPTATDELRRMLDERGVEWWVATPCKTKWNSPIIGGPVAAREWNGEMVLDTGYTAVTPEQAIAATLGDADATGERQGDAGTCHDKGTFKSWGLFTCSNCSIVFPLDAVKDAPSIGRTLPIRYCPNCGRRVEQ